MGRSCQAVCLLVKGLRSVMALPLAARIHEGVVFSNRDKRTLLDKMLMLIDDLNLQENFIFLADAYYVSRKIVLPLLEKGNHLVSRVRKNAVAYYRSALQDRSKFQAGDPYCWYLLVSFLDVRYETVATQEWKSIHASRES